MLTKNPSADHKEVSKTTSAQLSPVCATNLSAQAQVRGGPGQLAQEAEPGSQTQKGFQQ
jgi:hypothetical protein